MSERKLILIGDVVKYVSAVTVIGIACKVTKSAKPLWAMLFLPSRTIITSVSEDASRLCKTIKEQLNGEA